MGLGLGLGLGGLHVHPAHAHPVHAAGAVLGERQQMLAMVVRMVADNPLHEALVQDILKCLHLCKQSGECGKKGKHTHEIPKLDMDGAHHFALSVYWSRNAVGIKARQNNVATGQVSYFAKQTPCCATNILLATMWVKKALSIQPAPLTSALLQQYKLTLNAAHQRALDQFDSSAN